YYELIISASRYSGGLSTYPDGIKSAQDTIQAIWAGGYATDELYVSKVMSIINSNNLTEFDKLVDGATFDPGYTWEGDSGDTGGSSGTVPTSAKKYGYKFEKIEQVKL
ncbi:MAG: hypothetical protein J6R88_00085, partial [Clostridia bacterium]|nr:hypothetical protein [Clostridia bacterium]